MRREIAWSAGVSLLGHALLVLSLAQIPWSLASYGTRRSEAPVFVVFLEKSLGQPSAPLPAAAENDRPGQITSDDRVLGPLPHPSKVLAHARKPKPRPPKPSPQAFSHPDVEHRAVTAEPVRQEQPEPPFHGEAWLPVARELGSPSGTIGGTSAAGGVALEDGTGGEMGVQGARARGEPLQKAAPHYDLNPRPAYPEAARRRGFQGTVILAVRVLADGAVAYVRVAKTSGHEILDQAAARAVAGWRFIPGRRGEQPVATEVQVPVRFQLE